MGLFLIYIPIESHPDSFFIRSKAVMSTYQNVLDNEDELWFDLGNDLQYSNLKHLIPFASSENGHYLVILKKMSSIFISLILEGCFLLVLAMIYINFLIK